MTRPHPSDLAAVRASNAPKPEADPSYWREVSPRNIPAVLYITLIQNAIAKDAK